MAFICIALLGILLAIAEGIDKKERKEGIHTQYKRSKKGE